MAVQVGDEAPDFTLPDQDGTPVRLSDFRGLKNVLLVFYPLAFSGICEGELCALRDDPAALAGPDGDPQVLTVSVDSMFAHRAWADQQGYKFPLLADFWPHGGVAQAYGCFDEHSGRATRGTYILATAGVVRWKVVHANPDARDQGDYLKALADL
jgi:mycoredoxin-dependent peroxiredoxin